MQDAVHEKRDDAEAILDATDCVRKVSYYCYEVEKIKKEKNHSRKP